MAPETLSIIQLVIQSATTILVTWIGRRMYTLEKNTNSIKDELVRTTRLAAHAAGVKDEKERQAQQPPNGA